MDLYFFYIGLKEKQLQRCYSCVLSVISTDFGRIFRNMDYWIELNGYCLNCSESQSSGSGRTNLYGHQYYQN
jgi:hypothetical protein